MLELDDRLVSLEPICVGTSIAVIHHIEAYVRITRIATQRKRVGCAADRSYLYRAASTR